MVYDSRRKQLDYSKITDNIYIGRLPRTKDYALLKSLGVGLVINMRFEKRMKRDDTSEIERLWLPAIDTPLTLISVSKIQKAVQAALDVINKGKVVYINCKLGRHRSVVVGTCILIAQGYDPDEAMTTVKRMRPSADFKPRYIRRQIERYVTVIQSSTKQES